MIIFHGKAKVRILKIDREKMYRELKLQYMKVKIEK